MAPHLSVLVVEDDPEALCYFCALITGWGYNVKRARSALDAISMVEDHCPDVIVSDLVMPGMSGLELLRFIRALSGCSNVSFILITGNGTGAAAVRAIGEGADEVLVKPFDDNALHETMKRVELKKAGA